MTPEQQRLSRLLAEHPECWEWWAGMSSGGWRLVRQSAISGWVAYRDDGSFSAILSPEDVDLSDPATAACLAAQAMEAGAWIAWVCGSGKHPESTVQGEHLGIVAARALIALGGDRG